MEPRKVSRAVSLGNGLLTLLLVVGVIFTAYLLIDTAVGAIRGGDRPFGGRGLDVRAELEPEKVKLPRGLKDAGEVPVRLHLARPSGEQVLYNGAPDLIMVLPWLLGLILMRRLLRSVGEGEPFGESNVKRLRGLGYVCVAGGLIVPFAGSALRQALFDTLPADTPGTSITSVTLPGAPFIAAIGAFILAEVFAHGLRLREDVEGTV